MDGVHDMGGMHGFGPVVHEDNEPVFHEPWEGRVYALSSASEPPYSPNLDAGRYSLEQLPPAVYLGSSYYERWLLRAQIRLIELGRLTQEEIEARMDLYREDPDAPVPRHSNPVVNERVKGRYTRLRERLDRPEGAPPRFAVGDKVRARNIHPKGHTRLPRYARGKVGLITRVHGRHPLPDTVAHGLGDHAQGLYSVRFEADELWGVDAEGRGCVYIDLWDSYLDPVLSPPPRAGEG